MSGARITLHAALELARRGSGYAVAALCGAGGQGDALILRRRLDRLRRHVVTGAGFGHNGGHDKRL